MIFELKQLADEGRWDEVHEIIDKLYENVQYNERKRPIVFDFDGVIHDYRTWEGPDVISGKPLHRSISVLNYILSKRTVYIMSYRCNWQSGIDAMKDWLKRNGVLRVDEIVFHPGKPPAFLIIDDHAHRYDGYWPDPNFILNFRSWGQISGKVK